LYDLANASERWDLAASLLKRLQALPTDSNVTSIDSARRKRGK
jgi:hypothetical protein